MAHIILAAQRSEITVGVNKEGEHIPTLPRFHGGQEAWGVGVLGGNIGTDGGAGGISVAVHVGGEVRDEGTVVGGYVHYLHTMFTQWREAGRHPARLGGGGSIVGLHAGLDVVRVDAAGGGKETGIVLVVGGGSGRVLRAQSQHFELGGAGPVGQIVVGNGGIADVRIEQLGGLHGVGSILHITVGIHLSAPKHGVGNHGGLVDIHAGAAAIATTGDDDVGAGAFVAHNGVVVHLATFVHEHAAGLGGRGVVGHHAAGQSRIEAVAGVHANRILFCLLMHGLG